MKSTRVLPSGLPDKHSAVDLSSTPVSPSSGSPRTIMELVQLRARQLPNEPIFGYPKEGIEYTEYTFSQLERFSLYASRHYSRWISLRQFSSDKERVVGLLGLSSLDYFVVLLALSRLGFTVLFLSTRISEEGYLSLLNETECRTLIVGPGFERTSTLLSSKLPGLKVFDIVNDSVYDPPRKLDDDGRSLNQLDLNKETSKIAWIIHSSGSTGPPKPIFQTHKAALGNYAKSMNMVGFVTLPLFHAHGLSCVFRAMTCVKKMYMYSASLPLTSQYLLEIMQKHEFEVLYGVPYALKLLSETQAGIERLAAMKVVMFAGSACPDALGDLLVASGVNLISHFGTTETGQLMDSVRKPGDTAWNYVRVSGKLRPYVRFEEKGGNLYELVVLEGWPSKVATNRPDGAYATKDLFEKHPTILDAWKYSARLDDTLVLETGEKVIPIAMEQAVRQNKLVKEALMFGAGRSQSGLMIIPSDLSKSFNPDELIDALWPTIDTQNKLLPAYGRLSRDAVSVLPSDSSYLQTDKGTIIRQAFYRTYERKIDDFYKNLEFTTRGSRVLSDTELRAFLRTEVSKHVPEDIVTSITDDTDLFILGIDSLQSTQLRSTIIKEIELGGSPLPRNIVFEYPTIAKLATRLLRAGETLESSDMENEMEQMVSKYGNFPQHTPAEDSKSSCIVVTGATGSLGAHIVSQLVMRDDIEEVACLVRATSVQSAQERVITSLKEKMVLETLSPEAQLKITSYPSDFSKPDLGLSSEQIEDLRMKGVAIIHSAWSVNFNKSLSSFEGDCVAGARNLIDLCLSTHRRSPASFNFCSSVSAVANISIGNVPEGLPDTFSAAQGMGYAQSKLVTEHLVTRAASQTGMQARVLRIGQVIADTENGMWNDTEAIPLMLQSAKSMGALPTLDESPRWLPVDTVANAVIDIALSSTSETVFNIVNLNTFHWTKDLLPALRSAGLKFDEVEQREWIRRLRASNPDPVANPTIKLVDFFASKYDNDEIKRGLTYTTTVAQSLSPALKSAPVLSEDSVKKFVQHFLSTWK